jgi:hypothetical protein
VSSQLGGDGGMTTPMGVTAMAMTCSGSMPTVRGIHVSKASHKNGDTAPTMVPCASARRSAVAARLVVCTAARMTAGLTGSPLLEVSTRPLDVEAASASGTNPLMVT